MGSSFLTCLKKAGLLLPLAIGHEAGLDAREEQKEDSLWSRQDWAQISALPTLDKLPTLPA